MKNKVLKLGAVIGVVAVIIASAVVALNLSGRVQTSKALNIIATGFPEYDFARAVVGEDAGIKMLLKPGAEAHDFEPTSQDLTQIRQADLLIYGGGESDEWVGRLLKDNEVKATVKLMDLVELKTAELKEEMKETKKEAKDEIKKKAKDESQYDEHVWTSPKNAIKLVNGIRDKVIVLAPEKADGFRARAKEYVAKLERLDTEFRAIVASAKRKTLVFGDHFPFRYFVEEYGLDYFAAFPDCLKPAKASSKTVAFLVAKIKATSIPVVLKTELSNNRLAETIAKETGAKVVEFNAIHNISQADFDHGVTYVDLMTKNIEALKEALN